MMFVAIWSNASSISVNLKTMSKDLFSNSEDQWRYASKMEQKSFDLIDRFAATFGVRLLSSTKVSVNLIDN